MASTFKFKVFFRKYVRVSEVSIAYNCQNLDVIDHYVIDRIMFSYDNDSFRIHARTILGEEKWNLMKKFLSYNYTSIVFHRLEGNQAFKFDDEADEAAFILASSDGIDV